MTAAGSRVSRRELLVLGGLVAAAGATVLAVQAIRPVGDLLKLTPAVQAALAEPGPEAGNPAGDLTMLVFTDFNCGACRSSHPAMMAAVSADGGVRLRFLDWPVFGDDSRAAARVALAADVQGLYLPVHRTLMQGGRADGPAAEAAVAAAGGDMARLRATLAAEGPRLDGRLARHRFHAFALGMQGTPSHLAGRVRVQGGLSEVAFGRVFARARATKAPDLS